MPLLNWQGSHCLSLWHGRSQAAALRVAADPVPHAEILNYIKKSIPAWI
jgi:D-methionine transport system substrate-binding protein